MHHGPGDPTRAFRVSPSVPGPRTWFLQDGPGIPFSPDLRALGTRRLPDFVVIESCARLVGLRDVVSCEGVPVHTQLRPRIWEDDWDSGPRRTET